MFRAGLCAYVSTNDQQILASRIVSCGRAFSMDFFLYGFKEEIRCNVYSLQQYLSLAAFCAGGRLPACSAA
jgi:hypothetical protein